MINRREMILGSAALLVPNWIDTLPKQGMGSFKSFLPEIKELMKDFKYSWRFIASPETGIEDYFWCVGHPEVNSLREYELGEVKENFVHKYGINTCFALGKPGYWSIHPLIPFDKENLIIHQGPTIWVQHKNLINGITILRKS